MLSTLFKTSFWCMVALVVLVYGPRPASAEVQPFETQLPIMCGDAENILKGLREKYGEEIIFMAPGVNSQGHKLFHSLWINPETTSWSFVVVNKDREALCVISSGDNYQTFGPAMI